MFSVLATLALCLPQESDPTPKLVELCKASKTPQGYRFELRVESEGGFGRGGDEGPPPPIQGSFQKDKPVHLKQGDVEAYRDGDKFAYRNGDGEWQQMPAPGQGGGGMRMRGGPGMREAFGLRSAPLPHEFLTGVEKKVVDVKVEKSATGMTWTGKLTPEAASEFSGGSMFRRMRGGPGGAGEDDGPEISSTGTFTIKFDSKDVLTAMKISTTMSGSFGDRSFERKRANVYGISAIGATKLEVPEKAAKKLAEEPWTEEEF